MKALVKRIIKTNFRSDFNKNRSLSSTKKSSVISAGFTLIELLVVLGIFALIMSVALFNQASLSSNVLITNLAYETALAVREAQTYGISVRATASSTSASSFDRGYGAYFDMAHSDQVIVFADADGFANGGAVAAPSQVQSLYQIQNQRGNRITALCLGNTSGGIVTPCKAGGANSVDKLSIIFKRPNPESSFFVASPYGNWVQQAGPAVIVVNNADNSNCRAIIVEVTGQIRVENSSATNPNCSNGK